MIDQEKYNDNNTFLAQWLAGELSDNELKTLVSESDFQAYLKLRKGIDTIEGLEASTDDSFAKIQNRITNSQTKVRSLNAKSWYIGIAASVILLFGLFSIFGNDVISLETGYGEQKTIALLDGSEVIMNSKSVITYNEGDWKNDRKLHLKGEAYFKVKKGSTFTVVTDNGTVQVLGTQFNVNAVDDLFEVVCFEGKVRVTSQNESYNLMPTNSVRRINGNAIERWDMYNTNPRWIHGESSFKSVPLKYVVNALEAQYNIQINDQSIDNNILYTGSFTHKNLNTALKTVFKSLDIQYFEKEKGHIYLSIK